MNTKPSPDGKTLAAICASALLLAGPINVSAADGTWTNDSGGNWSDVLNWSGGTVADGAGSTANFSTVDLLYSFPTVTLDSPRTVGSLVFGDADSINTPEAGWILAGSALTLDAGVATPVITVSNLQNAYGTNDARITATVSSALGFLKKGTNTLTLTAANSFNAPVQLDEGLVAVGIAAALGTNAVVMNGGGVGIISGAYGNR